MQLDDFIRESLVQITRGVISANDSIRPIVANAGQDHADMPDVFWLQQGLGDNSSAVEFDLAVTLKSDNDKGGGIGLAIAVFQADARARSLTSHETVQRIRFRVAVRTGVS